MVIYISENVLNVNHKVKILNFPYDTSEKILEKMDVIIKEKSDDLIVHVGTTDITNNINLLTNVKKIFNKVSKELPWTSIAFLSIINCKDTTNIQKNLTDRNTRLKNFSMQKGIRFIDNTGIKKFHLVRGNFIWTRKEAVPFAKHLLHYISRTGWSFFPYDLVAVNECLSNTFEKAKFVTNSTLQTLCKDNFNKVIFASLNINSVRNKFDSLAEIIKHNIEI